MRRRWTPPWPPTVTQTSSRCSAGGRRGPGPAAGASFVYLWDHTLPGPQAATYRAFHSSEVPYMFGSLDLIPGRTFTDRDREIAARMMDIWAAFVKTGQPDGAGLPAWPREGVMRLGQAFEPLPPVPADRAAQFNAWNDRTGAFSF